MGKNLKLTTKYVTFIQVSVTCESVYTVKKKNTKRQALEAATFIIVMLAVATIFVDVFQRSSLCHQAK
jgi:hypothetical protein